jgi:isoleucyl-tRNA synthetase
MPLFIIIYGTNLFYYSSTLYWAENNLQIFFTENYLIELLNFDKTGWFKNLLLIQICLFSRFPYGKYTTKHFTADVTLNSPKTHSHI